MKFSLIMATLGRYDEVGRLLTSLAKQSFTGFELIVVDQNKDDRVKQLCREYQSSMDIHYLHLDRVGLSLARNAGLHIARGDIVAFPDDDCEYPADLLARISERFSAHAEIDGLTGVPRNKVTGMQCAGRFDTRGGPISPGNVWRRAIAFTIFAQRTVADSINGFDEGLGLGAKFGSSEETDFLLRALHRGSRMLYCPDIFVYHPDPLATFDSKSAARAYSYGLGIGAVCKKHVFHYHTLALIPQTLILLARPLAGCLRYSLVDRNKSRYYLASLKGRLAGLIRYPSCKAPG